MDWVQDMTARWVRILSAAGPDGTPLDEAARQMAFTEAFTEAVARLRLGDPMAPDTDMGPKISLAELEKVERMISGAQTAGATVVMGGHRPNGQQFAKGYWLAPTVLTDVRHDMDIMRSEVFGPVATIMPFDDVDEVIQLANDTDYGLSAYIYSNNLRTTMTLIDELNCGEVYVNNIGPEQVQGYHSGTGLSGYGGDDGVHGLDRYLRRKSIYLSY